MPHNLPLIDDNNAVDDTLLVSGIVQITNRHSKPKLYAEIHQTSGDHFAIFYPLRHIISPCRPFGAMNLKTVTVEQLNDDMFSVRPRKDIDGISFIFRLRQTSGGNGEKRIEKWMKAMNGLPINYNRKTNRMIKRISFLPTLAEDNEIEA